MIACNACQLPATNLPFCHSGLFAPLFGLLMRSLLRFILDISGMLVKYVVRCCLTVLYLLYVVLRGGDHLVKYEVFGTSPYLCCIEFLCVSEAKLGGVLGVIWGFLDSLRAVLRSSWAIMSRLGGMIPTWRILHLHLWRPMVHLKVSLASRQRNSTIFSG